jgi:hypothetical protein
MFPSKTHKTVNLISNYLVNQKDTLVFLQECKMLDLSFSNAAVSSKEFQNTVVRVFEICKDIGIAQLLPSILYIQVINAYNIYNDRKTIINELEGMDFVDNTTNG